MTYPKITTAAVEMITAKSGGRILSKKIGRASRERALESRRVDKRRW